MKFLMHRKLLKYHLHLPINLLDRAIDNKAIIIEQTIIKQGIEEVLILGSISSEENLNCENAIYKESVKRKEITISFRQVSHLTTSAYSFSFYLITLMTSASKKGSQINLKLNVNINSVLTEKTCGLLFRKRCFSKQWTTSPRKLRMHC